MKKLIIIACMMCSCATTNYLTPKEERIIINIAFLASFDVVCFTEEIVVRKVSPSIYEARCIHNDRTAYYSVVGYEITRIK